MRGLKLESWEVFLPEIQIPKQQAQQLLNFFKEQLYENQHMRCLLFELDDSQSLTIWVHALAKDGKVMEEGYSQCSYFTKMTMSDEQKFQDIFNRQQSED